MKYLPLLFLLCTSVALSQAPGVTFRIPYPQKDGMPMSRYKERRADVLVAHEYIGDARFFQPMCAIVRMMWTMSTKSE